MVTGIIRFLYVASITPSSVPCSSVFSRFHRQDAKSRCGARTISNLKSVISNRFLCEPLRPSDFAVKFHWNLSASINHTSRFTSADSRCIISPRSGRGRWGFRRVTTIWSAAVHIHDSRLTIHVNWFHAKLAKRQGTHWSWLESLRAKKIFARFARKAS